MSEIEVWVPVVVERPREVVWHALTASEDYVKWWWGTDELVAVEPSFEVGATLRFSSGWSTPITECLPQEALAFGDHRFTLSEAAEGATKLAWSMRFQGDPAHDQLTGADATRPYRQRMTVALDRFKELVETKHVLVEDQPTGPGPAIEGPLDGRLDTTGREVRVFVSSTFSDMEADRDRLARHAFPALRRLCRDRGVVFSEVDLRWGISDEQQAEGQVLPICLAEIDNSRPYFIALLGERYGSVPSHIPEELLAQQPWLAENQHRSVTELEILHGALNQVESAPQASFYFRESAYGEAQSEPRRFRETPTVEEIAALGHEEARHRAADRTRRLAELKAVIHERFDVRHYRDPEDLAAAVVEDLTAKIDARFPVGSTPSPNEHEAMLQEGFAAELRAGFIDRPDIRMALDAHVNDTGAPLVLTGEPGSGKSAALASWIDDHRARDAEAPVVGYFIDSSPRSSDLANVLRTLIHQIAGISGLAVDIPADLTALKTTFSTVLHAASEKQRLAVVIDGVDLLSGHTTEEPLNWLPPRVPDGVRLIVSTSPGRTLDAAARRSWTTLTAPPLDLEGREQLIKTYLSRFAKSLSSEHLARVATHPYGSNPRFLRILLDELRWQGDHSTLGRTIDSYLDVADVADLYERAFDRCEQHHEQHRPGLVRDALRLLWASREGLGEAELMELLGDHTGPLPQGVWAPLALAAEGLIVRRSGMLGLHNVEVRRAVESRYFDRTELRCETHLHLAAHFSRAEAGRRRAVELPWQLAQAGAWTGLYEALTDEAMTLDLWEEAPWDLRHYWAEIALHTSRSMVDGYRDVIEDPARDPKLAALVARLLLEGGYIEAALPLARQLAADARRGRNAGRLVVALNNLAAVLAVGGNAAERLECARELEDVAHDIGDRRGVAGALAVRAQVLAGRGDYADALRIYREEEQLRRKLDDRDGLQYCLGNQAQILVDRAQLDGALDLRREQERLSRDLGNLHALRIALGTQAVIHRMKGNHAAALDLHREEERLCRETGDKGGLQASLGNRALVVQAQGDLDAAMDLFLQQEELCRELGALQDLATSLNNQAGIMIERGHLDGAARLYEEQAEICRTIGYDLGLQAALGNQGLIRMHRGDARGAVDLFRAQEVICRRLGVPLALAHCLNNLVLPLQMLGETDESRAAAAEALDLVERHDLRAK